MSKILTGTVVSNKMTKTIVVDVQRRFQHPRFKKIINIHKKFKVHVEDGTVKVGDIVKIKETRPISKDKHFILVTNSVVEESKTRVSGEQKEVQKPVKKASEKIKKPAKVETASEVKIPAAKKTVKKVAKKTTTRKQKVSS